MRTLLYGSIVLFFVCREGKAQQPRILTHPEKIAGRWETSDGHGGAVGMNIMLATATDRTAKTTPGQPQFEQEFTVGLFSRKGAEAEPVGFNFSTASQKGGVIGWEGHGFRMHGGGEFHVPIINVDLTWHEDSHRWTGVFELGSFRNQVTLKRPAHAGVVSPFVGTWAQFEGSSITCVHIAQQPDGAFTAWSDSLQIGERMRYAKQIQPPRRVFQSYGDIATAKVDDRDRITLELQAYRPACCSRRFSAKLRADRKTLAGLWLNDANPAVEWKKMPGDSCILDPLP